MIGLDLKTFAEVSKMVIEWTEKALGKSKDAKQRHAVNLLSRSVLTLEAMRRLDQAFRLCSEELGKFQESWSRDQKEQLAFRLEEITRKEENISALRRHSEELKALIPGAEADDCEKASQLYKCAETVLTKIDIGDRTPVPDEKLLLRCVWALRGFDQNGCKSDAIKMKVKPMICELQQCFQAIEGDMLRLADKTYGALNGSIMARHKITVPI